MNEEGRLDKYYRLTTAAVSCALILFPALVLIFLLDYSGAAIRFNGLNFLTTIRWSLGDISSGRTVVHNGVSAPVEAVYGSLVFIVGTVATSALALLIAIPISIGIAIFIAEEAPPIIAGPLSSLTELLAGVPSVVYGLWGVVFLVPLMKTTVEPSMSTVLGWLPFVGQPVGHGYGLLTCGIILSLMIVPIVSSTIRDSFARTPVELKEGAMALGSTKWEMIRTVVIPSSKSSILGASILGLGRALGETMAILMVSGGAINFFPTSIYGPTNSMAAVIVSYLDSAFTDPTGMALYSLAEVALALFLITLAANMIARIFVVGGMVRAWMSQGLSRLS
jgi:phosphate transport system permease protein